MQALAKAGVVIAVRGAGGGYRLARPAAEITLWDLVEAIEGAEPAFRCLEIRRQGPCAAKPEDCKQPCEIASVFHRAERLWRDELKNATLAGVVAEIARAQSPARKAQLRDWLRTNL
jgi:Rrf2 family protein